MGVGHGGDVDELHEAEPAGVERVEVVLQRPVMVVGPDAYFPQAAVAADRAGVEVVGDVPVDDGAVRVVEGEGEQAARLERGGEGRGEAAVVPDVVEDQVGARGVEPPGQVRLGAAQVGDPVVDVAAGVLGPGQLDQARGQVNPGDVRAPRGQPPGEVALPSRQATYAAYSLA
jgi:hypothetical protein